MDSEQFVKAQLALYGWRHGTSQNGMIGVMLALRNRLQEYDGDWMAAILDLGWRNISEFPDIRTPDFITVLTAVDSVYDGSRSDRIIAGGKYFTFPGVGFDFDWTKHSRVATIGDMTFYA